METYVKFMFLFSVALVLGRCIVMAMADWPHQRTQRLGTYLFDTMVQIALAVRAAILLWVKP